MSKTTGLGKGLNAIFDIENVSNAARKTMKAGGGGTEIELEKIVVNQEQPRKIFDNESLDELCRSIERLGVIQPITVKEIEPDKYFIISGERRFRASIQAGLKTIPAYIRTVKDDGQLLEMALVENIQREELSPMEIAVTMQRLVEECALTQEQLADRVGKKRSTVANYLRLLKSPIEVQLALNENVISMGHARALLSLTEVEEQLKLLKTTIEKALSVRQIEDVIQKMHEDKPTKTVEKVELPPLFTELTDKLKVVAGEKVTIKRNARGRGKIIINFNSDSDIERIINNLK